MKKISLLTILLIFAFGTALNAQPKKVDDDAISVTQKVKANMKAGKEYSVTVSFKNLGEKTWEKGEYRIVYTDPRMNARNNNVWGIDSIKTKKNVKSGSTYAFKFKVTAPTEPGIYFFSWMMSNNNGTFGVGSELQQIVVSN